MDDISDIVLGERLEHDDLIQTVQKLRSEMTTQLIHNRFLALRIDIAVFVNALQQMRGAKV